MGPVVKCQFLIGWQRLKIKSEGENIFNKKSFCYINLFTNHIDLYTC